MKRSMAALVFGNGGYPRPHNLANPVNDAIDLGAKLEGYGFEVVVAVDCTAAEMEKQLKAFRELLKTYEIGLFFFAGHGIQIDGSNYLLALDTDMDSETDAKHSSLSLDKVVDIMEKSNASTKIIILDACRTNPWERQWHRSLHTRGLASVYAPKGTIIGFATSPGEVAFDGSGRNGTYTDALLQHIDTPDCSIETMFKRVRNTVAAASGGRQTSWEHTSLSGEFYFNLSLGRLIDDYDDSALADRLFELDGTKKSHQLIGELKTYNWYRQNPAIESLDADAANRMSKNSLFVIGRNIYQAACGSAGSGHVFINEFMKRTRGYEKHQRKAILDGMLFEVFFDTNGELRSAIKKEKFNELFELQRHVSLQESFDFIANALNVARGDFYVVPGKGHELAATISGKKVGNGFYVSAIYVDSVNVLKIEKDSWDSDDGEIAYTKISRERLREKLTTQLIVPERLLKLSYAPGEAEVVGDLYIPISWNVMK